MIERKLVTICGHTGYVDIVDNNPYATLANPSNPRLKLFVLEMEITASPAHEAGTVTNIAFRQGQVEYVEEE